ncbi:MAG TPA: class I tRNA ligase family protein, partial [Rhodopila sp.]|nr:class I tRNA ligase family protein [Rhodopila sp.]
AHVLGLILRLLHPAVPFVTEELWDRFGYGEAFSLIGAAWPEVVPVPGAAEARAELDWVVRLIGLVRSVRTEMNVPPSKPSPVLLQGASGEVLARVERWMEAVRRLARASEVLVLDGDMPKGSAQAVLDEVTIVLPLEGVIDLGAERIRLAKAIEKLEAEAKKAGQKLGNADFVSRAPAEVVAEIRERLEGSQSEIARLRAALDRLG